MQGRNNIIVNVFITGKAKIDTATITKQITENLEKKLIKKKKSQKNKTITSLNYLDRKEARKLMHFMEREKQIALQKNNKTTIKHWFFINVGIFAGLRVNEISKLSCSDYTIKDNTFILIIREAKGGKPNFVICPDKFKKTWFWFLQWKKNIGEPTDENSPMFYSPRTKTYITPRALQYAIKNNLRKCGLNTKYTPHSMRRTFGTYLNDISNTRLAQSLLRHKLINTTQHYTAPIQTSVKKAVEKYSKLFE